MRKQLTAFVSTAALALPAVNAVAAVTAPQQKTASVTRQFLGTLATADKWGHVQVLLVVRKTTTIVGTRKVIARRIIAVRVPEYPKEGAAHTIALNQRVIPELAQQVLQAHSMTVRIQVISEATDTSVAFNRSLQAALYEARRT
jgi:hypothetical protein